MPKTSLTGSALERSASARGPLYSARISWLKAIGQRSRRTSKPSPRPSAKRAGDRWRIGFLLHPTRLLLDGLVDFVGCLRIRPHARAVFPIPALQHIGPIAQALDGDELLLHQLRLRVEAAVFDPHLAHAPPGQRFAVNLHGYRKMLRH